MSRIQLFLNNNSLTYYPGNVINGKLECYFNSEKNIRGIKVKCTGKEIIRWQEQESQYNSLTKKHENVTVTYTGENIFLRNEISVLGGSENVLPAGKHTYTFSFVLPNSLPSTFEANHGSIKYRIKAVVDRPWKTDYTAEIFFIVLSPIDLNLFGDGIREPIERSDDKNMCCCFCESGPLTMTVTVPKAGYAPGESIDFSAHIENLSNVNVTDLKFQFLQKLTLKATSPKSKYKEEKNYLGEVRERGVGAHGDYVFQLHIPISENLIPPNFANCKLFEAEHYIKAVARVPSPHTNLSFTLPLKFGHIPLRDLQTSQYVQQLPIGLASSFSGGTAPPYPINMPFPQGPPSYISTQLGPSAPSADNNIPIKQSTSVIPSAPEAPPPSYDDIIKSANFEVINNDPHSPSNT